MISDVDAFLRNKKQNALKDKIPANQTEEEKIQSAEGKFLVFYPF